MEGRGAYVYVLAVAAVKSFRNHCFMVTGIHIPMIDPLFYFVIVRNQRWINVRRRR
jgi:hypothetical protein